jgi:DNA-binding MarR family transcriptional regulator
MTAATSRIQREIRQTRPFPSATDEALVALLRTTDVVRSLMAHLIEPYGVTPQQYNVLRILRGAGEAGLPTLEIAARMIEAAPGITRLMDRLERKNLVRRERCRHDRRQILCWITPAGLTLLRSLDAPVAEAGRRVMSGLSSRRVAQLVRLLDEVRAGVSVADSEARPGPTPASFHSRGDRK